jgi:hypothetical protein
LNGSSGEDARSVGQDPTVPATVRIHNSPSFPGPLGGVFNARGKGNQVVIRVGSVIPVFTGIIRASKRIYQPEAAVKVTFIPSRPIRWGSPGIWPRRQPDAQPLPPPARDQRCGCRRLPELSPPPRSGCSSEPFIFNQPPTFLRASVSRWPPAAAYCLLGATSWQPSTLLPRSSKAPTLGYDHGQIEYDTRSTEKFLGESS